MPGRRKPASPFRRFNSLPEVIRLVVMMCVRFPLSLWNVEDLLFERGIDIYHETVRFWWNQFGPMFATDIRRQRVSRMRGHTHWRWHLDEMFVKINGETQYLWRAVVHEGQVLESYVTKKRDKSAALRFSKKALKRHGRPVENVTDGLLSCPAAMKELGCEDRRGMINVCLNVVDKIQVITISRIRSMTEFFVEAHRRITTMATRCMTTRDVRTVVQAIIRSELPQMELSTTDILRRIETGSETLVVDGMLSGTGIRLKYAGGFIKLDQLPISTDLKKDISTWVLRYQNEHFENFQRVDVNAQLDNHGLKIVENLRETLGTNSVVYFSNAYMRYL